MKEMQSLHTRTCVCPLQNLGKGHLSETSRTCDLICEAHAWISVQLPLDVHAFTALESLHMDRNQIVDVPPNTR